mgnify:CR=1 FL=1
MSRIVPKGVAFVDLPPEQETEVISFLLLPKLSMLAFSSAIEPLRIANQLTGQELYRWQMISDDGAPVTCSNGVEISANYALDSTDIGTSLFVCAGVEPDTVVTDRVAGLLRHHWRLGHRVGGLCSGAYALAKAGILKGHDFTLHWENIPPFRETFPDLEPLDQLYVIDGRILTCGGGSAATDLFLSLISQRFGADLAHAVLNMCLHPVHRSDEESQQASRAASLGTRNRKLLRILRYMEENIEELFTLDDLAEEFDVSRRQIERLFLGHVGVTPKQYLTELRLQRARMLLAETDLKVADIASACGFESSSHFSRRFRAKYGVSPHRFQSAQDVK